MHIYQVRHLPYVFGGEQPTRYNVHLYLVTVYNTIFRMNKYLCSILSELVLKAEMFENTKGVWSRKSKDRKYNEQKTKEEKTNNYQRIYYTEIKDWATRNTTKIWWWLQLLRKGKQFLLHKWHPSCYSC